jgi:hypothetical protein
MRMMHAASLGVFSLAGFMADGAATAQDLVRSCGGLSTDFSKSTLTIGGQEYQATVVDYAAGEGTFSLRISPTEGLSAERARQAAALQSDVICMQLDRLPVEIGAGRQDRGAWLFSSGCVGHEVRMEDKC